jgi:peroxiredoxin
VSRRWAVALAWLLAAGLLACGPSSEPDAGAAGEPEAEAPLLAPDFTLSTLDGRQLRLADLRGKTVVIDFWATWCPPCEFQIPILNEVYAAWRDRGVEVLGVSVDTAGPDEVRAYAEKHGATYPILLGTEALAREFGAPGFPSLVVIDPQGRFVGPIHVGLIEAPALEKALAEAAVQGAPTATSADPA